MNNREPWISYIPAVLLTCLIALPCATVSATYATLIQYLGKRSFGSMKMLAVGTMDKNRSASCAGQATRGT